jgi:hypothetical protein
VRGVAAAADALRGHFDVASGDCLVAAAWLHDIGYAPSVRSTGFHPVDGAAFARREGFDELVVALVAFHSGAPAEARERGINGLSAFSAPPQQVLDALTFCDLTTGPDGTAVSPRDRLHEVLQRYGPDDPVHGRSIPHTVSSWRLSIGCVPGYDEQLSEVGARSSFEVVADP